MTKRHRLTFWHMAVLSITSIFLGLLFILSSIIQCKQKHCHWALETNVCSPKSGKARCFHAKRYSYLMKQHIHFDIQPWSPTEGCFYLYYVLTSPRNIGSKQGVICSSYGIGPFFSINSGKACGMSFNKLNKILLKKIDLSLTESSHMCVYKFLQPNSFIRYIHMSPSHGTRRFMEIHQAPQFPKSLIRLLYSYEYRVLL